MELNADLGESWYDRRIGNDAALMPFLDACNVACGFHGGDALTMAATIDLALHHGVAIGAHPSFPDRKNFGRRTMRLPTDQLRALILYQLSALDGMVRAAGSTLSHLKPHGALYHFANGNVDAAAAITDVMKQLGIPLLYGPPAGELSAAAGRAGLRYFAEGFVDRQYEPSLRLRLRDLPGASIDDPARVVKQARELLLEGKVTASDGRRYPLSVQTLCLHGDHAGAAERARAVRMVLDQTEAP